MVFANDLLIKKITPKKGSLEGGYVFTIEGDFDIAVEKGI